MSIQSFLENSKQVHGNTYDYSRVCYTNTHTKVEIVCRIHGSFQQRPMDHIRGRGCPVCAGKHYWTLDTFLEQAKEIHGESYDYSNITEFKGYEVKHTIICPQHGPFDQTPKSHTLNKQGCPQCGRTKSIGSRRLTKEQFILSARKTHGDVYDYSKVKYTNSMNKVEIVCKDHGPFFQTPNNHTSKGQGCPKCANERKGGLGGYTTGFFEKHPEIVNVPALFYVIEMRCKTDNFIKVGITKHDIKTRYARTGAGKKHIQKNVFLTKYMSLKEAYDLEQHILKALAHHKYYPNYVMDGRTECFKNQPDVLTDIQQEVDKYLIQLKESTI